MTRSIEPDPELLASIGLDANVRADGTIEVLAYRGTEHDTDASAVTPLTAEQARALAAELIAAAEESESAGR